MTDPNCTCRSTAGPMGCPVHSRGIGAARPSPDLTERIARLADEAERGGSYWTAIKDVLELLRGAPSSDATGWQPIRKGD